MLSFPFSFLKVCFIKGSDYTLRIASGQSAAEIDEMKPAPDEYMLAAAEKGTFGQKTWVCPDKSQILIEVRVNKQSKTCLI
ncbi:hypothetical protein P8452_69562 [Trifolium repens]|nr:hypothetical protein P8452_69562 [Trifolium repens]